MPMKEETRQRVRRQIHRMVAVLDDSNLVFVYRLIGSAVRNQTRRAERKGGA